MFTVIQSSVVKNVCVPPSESPLNPLPLRFGFREEFLIISTVALVRMVWGSYLYQEMSHKQTNKLLNRASFHPTRTLQVPPFWHWSLQSFISAQENKSED